MALDRLSEEWREDAACKGHATPSIFFPHVGESSYKARLVCRTCSVIEPCMDYGFASGASYGIWGGQNIDALRRQVRRDSRKKVKE